MSPDDVNRLYLMLSELRDEVHGYRKDLNGRLRHLEAAEAKRQGGDAMSRVTKNQIYTLLGLAISLTGLVTAITVTILERI